MSTQATSLRQLPIALSIILFLLAVFFWRVIFLGRTLSSADVLYFFKPWSSVRPQDLRFPSNATLSDQATQFYPFAHFARERVREGDLPLWNPYILCGAPFLANTQSALLFPFTALYYLLPLNIALGASAILRLLVAGLGTYCFVLSLGASGGSAMLAAIIYMFSAYNIVWLLYPNTNVSILLPLLFLCAENLVSKATARSCIWLALVVGLQLLGGHVESSFHSAVAVGFYFLFRLAYELFGLERGRSLPADSAMRRLLLFVSAYALGFLLAAVTLFPFLEYLFSSSTWRARSSWQAEPFPLGVLKYAILFFVPDLLGNPAENNWWGPLNYNELSGYAGVITLALLAVSLSASTRNRNVVFFSALLLLSLIMIYRISPLYRLLAALPLFKQAVNSRLFFVCDFSLAVLAALGLNSLSELDQEKRRRVFKLVAPVILLVSVGVAFVCSNPASLFSDPFQRMPPKTFFLRQSARFLLLAIGSVTILSLFCYGRLRHQALKALACALAFLDLFWFGSGYNPAVKSERVFAAAPEAIKFLSEQEGQFRFLALGEDVFPPNTAMAYRIADVRGYDFPVLDRFDAFFELMALDRPDVAHTVRKLEKHTLRYLSLLNVAFLASSRKIELAELEPGALELVYDKEIKVYRNRMALPRAFIVHRFIPARDAQSSMELLERPDVDLSKAAIIEEMLPRDIQRALHAAPTADDSRAEVLSYEPDRVRIKARMRNPGILVLSDTYFNGWRVRVDGRTRAIYRANYLLRGVYLEEGEHDVEFAYEPASFWIGGAFSALAAALIAGWLAFKR